jgi:hypothetical protein|tara:strand:+ start:207 stop:821 length:615 start_codon:yes stop_codon:yes gene_type:complete
MEHKMPLTVIPEHDTPLPDDFEEEKPTTFNKKVKVAAATAKVLMEAGAEIPTSTQEKVDAQGLFKVFTDPEAQAKLNPITNKHLQTPATVQHLYQMINDYDHQVIDEAVQLRRFITNKLIEDTGHTDARHRLRALELLGKISDVGLFSEKTEINVNHNSPEDLEDQIKSKIYKLLGEQKTIDTSFETIEEELGEIEDKPDDEVK